MFRTLSLFFGQMGSSLRSRNHLLLENLALRQQLAVLKAKYPHPHVPVPDRVFWVLLRKFWPDWKPVLVIVQPETVVRWHRAGFKLYWTWISRKRKRLGRRPTTKTLRELIFRMVAENRTWGAPRIHGDKLLHRTDDHLWYALRLLRHLTR
jgi:putative transposase